MSFEPKDGIISGIKKEMDMASALYDKLMEDMKAAMKAHDMTAVNAIRGVIAKAKDLTVNAGKEMSDEAVLAVISGIGW